MRKNRLDPRPANRSGQILFFLFAALAAVLSLTVCTKSSFLYPLNDWVDVHCYFTVGRGILHGMVPYRDLYEQKGRWFISCIIWQPVYRKKVFSVFIFWNASVLPVFCI